jgi:formate/nitrite transporter FocA (FNT family)
MRAAGEVNSRTVRYRKLGIVWLMTKTATEKQDENEEAEERKLPSASIVFETIRKEGAEEIERTVPALLFSGLAAGLSMCFSLIAMGVISAALPPSPYHTLIESVGYTFGFVIVILGRQQLFTENTLTPVLVFLKRPSRRVFAKVMRLWSLVLLANLVGTLIAATLIVHAGVFSDDVRAAFLKIGTDAASYSWLTTFVKAIFAGWILALMVWLLPAAEAAARPLIIFGMTYLLEAAKFTHIIAGSVDVLYAVERGAVAPLTYLGGFLVPVLIGNIVGGVGFVALLNFGQVASDN